MPQVFCNRLCEQWRHRIPNLTVLLRARPKESKAIREGLKSRVLSHRWHTVERIVKVVAMTGIDRVGGAILVVPRPRLIELPMGTDARGKVFVIAARRHEGDDLPNNLRVPRSDMIEQCAVAPTHQPLETRSRLGA